MTKSINVFYFWMRGQDHYKKCHHRVLPPKLNKAFSVVECYLQNMPFHFNFVYIQFIKMNEERNTILCSKKNLLRKNVQYCKYAIRNLKRMWTILGWQYVRDVCLMDPCDSIVVCISRFCMLEIVVCWITGFFFLLLQQESANCTIFFFYLCITCILAGVQFIFDTLCFISPCLPALAVISWNAP